jgi:hypothetical protein
VDDDLVLTGWALRREDGSVVVSIGHDVDEAKIWRVGLGWPTEEEIDWAKQHGARAYRCRLLDLDARHDR